MCAISCRVTLPLTPRTSPFCSTTAAGSCCNSLAPMRLARSPSSRQAVATAPPAMTMTREPQVPVEYGVIAVSPRMMRTLATSTPSISMRDLRQRRFQALPMRMHADAQFEAAIRRQARGSLFVAGHHRNAPAGIDRGPVRGLLAIDREADADPAPVGLALALACPNALDIDGRKRAPHRLGIVAAVEVLLGDVVERHLLGPHQIAQAHFARLQPGFRRDQIEHQFQRKADAGARHAAIGQDRAFVGRDRKRPAAIGRHR